MTADELLHALGPGWRDLGDSFAYTDDDHYVIGYEDGRYEVVWGDAYQSDGITYLCPDSGAAVAVAHLLIAADAIADGAEVEEPPAWLERPALPVKPDDEALFSSRRTLTAGEAYGVALDFLRAAAAVQPETGDAT